MEEFSDDFSVVLRGASLCLHHPCLRLKVFTTWVFEDTKFSAADERSEMKKEFLSHDEGGQFAKNDAPLLLFCQLSKEDKLMPLERSPPERGRVKILNLS